MKRSSSIISGMVSAVLIVYILFASVKEEKCWHAKLHDYKVKVSSFARSLINASVNASF